MQLKSSLRLIARLSQPRSGGMFIASSLSLLSEFLQERNVFAGRPLMGSKKEAKY